MKFYTTQTLSSRQKLTPEGFLFCEDVPIARIGDMIYGPGEIPITPGNDGRIVIMRDAKDVFRKETLASFQGKPVVDDHPSDDINPDTWNDLSRGITLNPRRGTGSMADFVLADLLITNRDMIAAIRSGKREVSCGYDAEYEELAPGRGRQFNIVGNHVALVERGRCGYQCSIRDKETNMTRTADHGTSRFGDFVGMLRKAFETKDRGAFDAAVEEVEKTAKEMEDHGMSGVHLHLGHTAEHHAKHHPGHSSMHHHDDEEPGWHKSFREDCDKRFKDIHEMFGKVNHHDSEEEKKKEEEEERKKREHGEDANREIEGNLEIEAPPGTGDKARKAKDSAYLDDSFRETISLAEILVPGIRTPTFDRASDPKKTFDCMCKLRRDALEFAYNTPDTRPIIDRVLGGKTVDFRKATCDSIRGTFIAAANVKALANNGTMRLEGGGTIMPTKRAATCYIGASPADINRMNAERFKKVS